MVFHIKLTCIFYIERLIEGSIGRETGLCQSLGPATPNGPFMDFALGYLRLFEVIERNASLQMEHPYVCTCECREAGASPFHVLIPQVEMRPLPKNFTVNSWIRCSSAKKLHRTAGVLEEK